MNEPVYIVDVIGEVVEAVTAAILPTIQANDVLANGRTTIETIDYQYGHKRELVQTLFEMDRSKSERFQRYPLVYLVQDFYEDLGRGPGIYADTSLNIILAHHTEQQYKITDRYAKVFKPVLYPILQELKRQLFKHPQIHVISPEVLGMRKWDRSAWGRVAVGGNDATKLNDYVDAIEIEQLRLKIKYPTCP